jgi:hypothetical protein
VPDGGTTETPCHSLGFLVIRLLRSWKEKIGLGCCRNQRMAVSSLSSFCVFFFFFLDFVERKRGRSSAGSLIIYLTFVRGIRVLDQGW